MCACLKDGIVTRSGEPSSFARSQYVQDLILGEQFCQRSLWIMPDVAYNDDAIPTTPSDIGQLTPFAS